MRFFFEEGELTYDDVELSSIQRRQWRLCDPRGFYAEDGSIIGCTANAVEPFGQSMEELTTSIADFQAALSMPVLTLSDIPRPSMPQKKRGNGRTYTSAEVRAKLGLTDTSTVKKEAS